MSKGKAMVVLSGGQDSTTCLFWAKRNFGEVHAVTINYGQRHLLELQAAIKVAKMAGVASHSVVNVPGILKSASPLTSENPLEEYTDFESMDRIIGDRVELTFVPLRNAFFLTLAANYALAVDCYHLVVGVCEADNANYPDCRASFIDAQERAINEALGIGYFQIHAPLISHSKAETINMAKALPGCMDAMAYSHTCYAGTYPPCGKCHACVLRAHGFAMAGTVDPLIARGANEHV
jgi:7-cyano-7-deazaguanine synthase